MPTERNYIHPSTPADGSGGSERPVTVSAEEAAKFFPISPAVIRPWFKGEFSIYLRQKDQYVLYTSQGQALSKQQRVNLREMGVQAIYIKQREKKDYEDYIQSNMAELLNDDAIPMKHRSAIWFHGSVSLVQNVFEEKLPTPLNKTAYNNIIKMVQNSILYFKKEGVMQDIMKLVSRGFKDYHHSVGTMCLTMFLLQSYPDDIDDQMLLRCCIGAMLHDVGKTRLPEALVSRNPESLMEGDLQLYQSHPNLGAGLCVELNLEVETFHCILFHHELDNGSGFPSSLVADSIPWYVKVLRLSNVYDNLTRTKTYRRADKPFDALQRIKNRKHLYGEDYIKRLVLVLANADVVALEEQDKKQKVTRRSAAKFYESL